MRAREIIKIASKLKKKEGSDPFTLCKKLNLEVLETKLNPNIYKAYTQNMFGCPVITINSAFTNTSQKVLCAHELGHAILHENCCYNDFDGADIQKEYEADLFAVSLLFEENQFDIPFRKMSQFMLHTILEKNIILKEVVSL